MSVLLEVCCGDIASVGAARGAGAARIELCSALTEGGLTPTPAMTRMAVDAGDPAVNVLIRPRSGDFLYSADEVAQMEAEIADAVAAGADGIVVGALTADGDVDVDAMRRFMAVADDRPVTFHRAFDLCRDPRRALGDLIALGCRRVLTSGQAASALEGAELIRRLVDDAAGKIIILAGGGVTAENCREIVRLTGVEELHASAKHTVGSAMRFRRADVSMGAPDADEYSRATTDASRVAAIIKALE